MKWVELITMQQEQIRLLTQLMKEHVAASRSIRRLMKTTRSKEGIETESLSGFKQDLEL